MSKLCKQPAAHDAEVQWRRLPILDCLPRGNLTALTAGILGSLYQIIQDYFVCTKFYKIQLSRKVDHLRVVLNHLLKEKTVINLSMFCSFHPAECLHNQKSHWPYLSDEISYYSYLMSQEAKYNLRLSLHIFLEILALFRCNTWFVRHPASPTTSLIILLSMSAMVFTTLNSMQTPSHSRRRPFCQVDRFNNVFQSPKSQLTSTLPFYCW